MAWQNYNLNQENGNIQLETDFKDRFTDIKDPLLLQFYRNSIFFIYLTNLDGVDLEVVLGEVFWVCESCNACFKVSTIWFMEGLSSGFFFKQESAKFASFRAAARE